MNVIESAAKKGITITHNNGTWLAEFGTELLLETTMLETMENFLNECELLEGENTLSLRISGFIQCKRRKAS